MWPLLTVPGRSSSQVKRAISLSPRVVFFPKAESTYFGSCILGFSQRPWLQPKMQLLGWSALKSRRWGGTGAQAPLRLVSSRSSLPARPPCYLPPTFPSFVLSPHPLPSALYPEPQPPFTLASVASILPLLNTGVFLSYGCWQRTTS